MERPILEGRVQSECGLVIITLRKVIKEELWEKVPLRDETKKVI